MKILFSCWGGTKHGLATINKSASRLSEDHEKHFFNIQNNFLIFKFRLILVVSFFVCLFDKIRFTNFMDEVLCFGLQAPPLELDSD